MNENFSVIRITNYLLSGIVGGVCFSWVLTLLIPLVPHFPLSERLASTNLESIPRESRLPNSEKISAASSGTSDLDEDGLPDDWEVAHSLDPADNSDAASDFDRDGLTALQEFLHGTSPLGVWREEEVDLGSGIIRTGSERLLKLTQSGYVLVSGRSADAANQPGARAILWHRET